MRNVTLLLCLALSIFIPGTARSEFTVIKGATVTTTAPIPIPYEEALPMFFDVTFDIYPQHEHGFFIVSIGASTSFVSVAPVPQLIFGHSLAIFDTWSLSAIGIYQMNRYGDLPSHLVGVGVVPAIGISEKFELRFPTGGSVTLQDGDAFWCLFSSVSLGFFL